MTISEEPSATIIYPQTEVTPSSHNADVIQNQIVTNLAALRCCDPSEISQEITQGKGDCVIDSPEAAHVVAALERHYGRRLAGQSDLRPGQKTSISSLRSLIQRRLGG
jgi:hypothetical protein